VVIKTTADVRMTAEEGSSEVDGGKDGVVLRGWWGNDFCLHVEKKKRDEE